jgi:hypothetical protein
VTYFMLTMIVRDVTQMPRTSAIIMLTTLLRVIVMCGVLRAFLAPRSVPKLKVHNDPAERECNTVTYQS